jgi:hypothetical protein
MKRGQTKKTETPNGINGSHGILFPFQEMAELIGLNMF